ncbi:hypothetical protein HK102_005173, partial [Quaeritorhiza haematococci]
MPRAMDMMGTGGDVRGNRVNGNNDIDLRGMTTESEGRGGVQAQDESQQRRQGGFSFSKLFRKRSSRGDESGKGNAKGKKKEKTRSGVKVTESANAGVSGVAGSSHPQQEQQEEHGKRLFRFGFRKKSSSRKENGSKDIHQQQQEQPQQQREVLSKDDVKSETKGKKTSPWKKAKSWVLKKRRSSTTTSMNGSTETVPVPITITIPDSATSSSTTAAVTCVEADNSTSLDPATSAGVSGMQVRGTQTTQQPVSKINEDEHQQT